MEQGILNNTIDKDCPCCEQVWLSLEPSIIPTLHYSPVTSELLDAVEWQRYEDIGGGNFDWVTRKTGGNTLSPFVYGDGDLWRVKYTDGLGCMHFSNVTFTYFA